MSAADDLHAALAAFVGEACERTAKALEAKWVSEHDAARLRIAELEAELLSARRTGFDEHEKTRARAATAEAQVARVLALHVGYDSPGPTKDYCRACPGKPLPCPTLRALDGAQ